MFHPQKNDIKSKLLDLPGGSVDKNLYADTEDMGLIPAPGRFHMLQSKLSLCTTTSEPKFQGP